ncbi:class I SAM-dependent methyltransferase [Novosphingobium album (ex Hu et al. 2023)]|uniref:Class I SAM-dependent methyltransferase n=1 Tax=Novosphingobium album (ex Hu et al. 2023) TaxID=2930093 RepID=A0ABT0B126_9SPHN|nr:class I SAM-dependent methyltransferase [Novosphingobium album (ex Hu et al. 2023)]MCJ2178605.1 class I SAM-dependent methyltransferase [Novosphingobium album (ex Hu et al. 2023)]
MNQIAEALHVQPDLKVDAQYGPMLNGRWVPAPRYVLRRDRVLAASLDLPPGRVLEIGCGSGALLREFAQRGHLCYGVETSEEARQLAGEMLEAFPTAQIVSAIDADTPADFDLVIACEVLEHIHEDAEALAQWVQCLRPGGRLILSVPAHMQMWGVRDVWAGHVRRYSRAGLVGLATSCGLKVQRIECYGFPLVNCTNVIANWSVRDKGLAGGAASQRQATAESGIDRSVHLKHFGLQTSLLGRLVMKTGCLAQRAFLSTNWGEGFIVIAERP